MKNGAWDAKGEEGEEVQHGENENRVGKNSKLFFLKNGNSIRFHFLRMRNGDMTRKSKSFLLLPSRISTPFFSPTKRRRLRLGVVTIFPLPYSHTFPSFFSRRFRIYFPPPFLPQHKKGVIDFVWGKKTCKTRIYFYYSPTLATTI